MTSSEDKQTVTDEGIKRRTETTKKGWRDKRDE